MSKTFDPTEFYGPLIPGRPFSDHPGLEPFEFEPDRLQGRRLLKQEKDTIRTVYHYEATDTEHIFRVWLEMHTWKDDGPGWRRVEQGPIDTLYLQKDMPGEWIERVTEDNGYLPVDFGEESA